ncbi:MAG: thioredoxin domain-containing protein [Nitrospirae bacterium]|nr:thioredoxin domain-containing protein [Nitrospirota bacterium]
MAKSNNNFLAIAVLVAAVVLSGSLVFLGTQSSCDNDELKAAVIEGVAEFVENGPPAEEPAVVTDLTDLSDDDAFIGDEDAPVTIVEFSDYQCPYCYKFYTGAYPELKKNYVDTGKVKIVFRDLPLSFHEGAYPAALAAECVRAQFGDEGYFAMHNKLFENQDVLSGDAQSVAISLEGFARDVGIDPDLYNECVANDTYKDEIFADISAAQSIGIDGTPSFVINQEVLIGAQPYETFAQIIEAELAK